MEPEFRGHLVVSGVRLACVFCRKRKIKCDGGAPCSGCIRFNRAKECSILSEESSSQGRSYVSYLQERIRTLENTEPPPRPATTEALPETESDELLWDVPEELPQVLSDSATDLDAILLEVRRMVDGPSSSVLVCNGLERWSFMKAMTGFSGFRDETGPLGELPSKDLVQPLVQRYLHSVYPIMPFIVVGGLERATERYCSIPRTASNNEIFLILMAMAIATATITRNAASVECHNALRLFSTAGLYAAYEVDSMEGLQATMLMLQFAIFMPSRLDGWYMSGVLCRSVTAMSFHLEEHCNEEQRRLFWGIIFLDRYIALATNRDFEIDERYITTKRPAKMTDVPNSGEIYLTRLALQTQIIKCYQELKTPGTSMDQLVRCNEQKLEAIERRLSPAVKPLLTGEINIVRLVLYRPNSLRQFRSIDHIYRLRRAAIGFISQLHKQVKKRSHIPIDLVQIPALYIAGVALIWAHLDASFHQELDQIRQRDYNRFRKLLAETAEALHQTGASLAKMTSLSGIGGNLNDSFESLCAFAVAHMGSAQPLQISELPLEVRSFPRHTMDRPRPDTLTGEANWADLMKGILCNIALTEQARNTDDAVTGGPIAPPSQHQQLHRMAMPSNGTRTGTSTNAPSSIATPPSVTASLPLGNATTSAALASTSATLLSSSAASWQPPTVRSTKRPAPPERMVIDGSPPQATAFVNGQTFYQTAFAGYSMTDSATSIPMHLARPPSQAGSSSSAPMHPIKRQRQGTSMTPDAHLRYTLSSQQAIPTQDQINFPLAPVMGMMTASGPDVLDGLQASMQQTFGKGGTPILAENAIMVPLSQQQSAATARQSMLLSQGQGHASLHALPGPLAHHHQQQQQQHYTHEALPPLGVTQGQQQQQQQQQTQFYPYPVNYYAQNAVAAAVAYQQQQQQQQR